MPLSDFNALLGYFELKNENEKKARAQSSATKKPKGGSFGSRR